MTTAPLLAYRVEIDSMRCVVFAASAPKARWMAVKAYWEAGYGRRGMWPRPAAARAPIYDSHWCNGHEPGRTYTESYLL